MDAGVPRAAAHATRDAPLPAVSEPEVGDETRKYFIYHFVHVRSSKCMRGARARKDLHLYCGVSAKVTVTEVVTTVFVSRDELKEMKSPAGMTRLPEQSGCNHLPPSSSAATPQLPDRPSCETTAS